MDAVNVKIALNITCSVVTSSSSFFERQQFIPVILILLLSCFNLCGQAAGQIIADRIKTVKDRNNPFLFLNRRHWQIYLSQSFSTHMRNACATLHTVQFYFFILKHIV